MPAAAAPGVFNYTSKINNSTYMLNTNPMAFEGAESFCNDYGGHLVSYGSKSEQQDVGRHGLVHCMSLRAVAGRCWLEGGAS